MFDLAHLVNISQQRAAEQRAAAAAASGGNTNGVERNPFLELLIPTGQEVRIISGFSTVGLNGSHNYPLRLSMI